MPNTRELIRNEVEATIARLEALNKAARKGGADERLAYNRVVLAKSRKFSSSEHAGEYMLALHGDPEETNIECFINILMRVTSKDDRRLRSKHGMALKFAALRKVKAKHLAAFLDEHGGYKGCAAKYQKAKAKAARRVAAPE